MIRWINIKDYDSIFNLLSQLTDSPTIDFKIYKSIIDKLGNNHFIFVYEFNNKVIGCISLLIEQKLIHGGKCVGHIEDLVVDLPYRKQNFGNELINYCIEICKNKNCYKIILDCKEILEKFYNKNNFVKQGICMKYTI